MSRAEENAQWVRDKIDQAGLTDWIAGRAYVAFMARYVPSHTIDAMFSEIVQEMQ